MAAKIVSVDGGGRPTDSLGRGGLGRGRRRRAGAAVAALLVVLVVLVPTGTGAQSESDGSDASLGSLSLSGADLGFDAEETEYWVAYGAAVEYPTVSAVAAQAGASVSISPTDVDIVAPGHQAEVFAFQPVRVTVTSADGTATRIYSLWMFDFRLQSLSVEGHDIGFDPFTAEYSLEVPDGTESATLSVDETKHTVAYSHPDADPDTEGHQVGLDVGDNTITVTATPKSRIILAPQTYTITVTRPPLALEANQNNEQELVVLDNDPPVEDDDASLSSLELTGTTLDFDPATLSYAVMYVAAADYATITATAAHPDATVSISVDDDENTDGHQIGIQPDHTVQITVTAADNVTTQTYEVAVWNARLRGLQVDGYDIGFDPATASYTLDVPHSVQTVTVGTGTKTNTKLDIAYSPATDADDNAEGHQVDLAVGANTITATVTLKGGTDTQTYTITITRATADTDASLSALELTGTTLSFDPNNESYNTVIDSTSVTSVTVTATAAQTDADVDISPGDADDNAEGHQVQLSEGDTTTVTVTVTAPDDTTTRTYQIDVAQVAAFARIHSLDLGNLSMSGGPTDAWSDGQTWYVNYWGYYGFRPLIRAYNYETGERDADLDIGFTSRSDPGFLRFNYGLWSDGEVMYVVEDWSECVEKFSLADGSYGDYLGEFSCLPRTKERSKTGMWSDGETLWVTENKRSEIRAYDLTSANRETSEDFTTLAAAGNRRPLGIWSDGVVMWVSDDEDKKIYAYDLDTKDRLKFFEFNTLDAAGNDDPRGLWSNGTTMWVADYWDDKLYAYAMPSTALLEQYEASDIAHIELSGIELGYQLGVTDYSVQAVYTLLSTTITAPLRNSDAQVEFMPTDADTDTPGHQIDLVSGSASVTVTVTDEDDNVTTYSIEITRDDAPAHEARLMLLGISDVELDFDDDTHLYRADVAADVESVTVTPMAYDPDATVVVLPVDADINAEGHQVGLTAGAANVVNVTVISEDTTEVVTYTIVINRPDS